MSNITGILEVMDLKDSNRKALLKIKMELQSVLEDSKVSDVSADTKIEEDLIYRIIENWGNAVYPLSKMVIWLKEYASIVNERKDNAGVKAAEYLKKSIEYAIAIHGKIIRESCYGGSTFIVFEDMVCYRLNFEAYNNEVTADESQPKQNTHEKIKALENKVDTLSTMTTVFGPPPIDEEKDLEYYFKSLPSRSKELQSVDSAGVNDAIEFADWISGEGYQQYDGVGRWIAPQNNLNVYSIQELYKIFQNKKQEKEFKDDERKEDWYDNYRY